MNKFIEIIRDFWTDENGLTLLEYILGAALIVAAFLSLGFWSGIKGSFGLVADKIATKAS